MQGPETISNVKSDFISVGNCDEFGVTGESQELLIVLVFAVTSPQPGPCRLVEDCPVELLGLLNLQSVCSTSQAIHPLLTHLLPSF